MSPIQKFHLLLTSLVLFAFVLPVHGSTPTPPPGAPLTVRLESSGQIQSLSTPAWELGGTVMFPLKTAVEYLGGSAVWDAKAQRVRLQSPQGHQAVVIVGFPRVVIDGRRLVRLPQLLALKAGQVLIAPESMMVIWREIGNQPAAYTAGTRTFRVGVPWELEEKAKPDVAPAKPAAEKILPVKKTPPAGLGCVVVDAGHGGKDSGAVGPSHLFEKDVTLEIAKEVAGLLEQEIGCKVIMTRRDDRFIPLAERPEIANQAKADLFISIHANASLDKKAIGSQVFIYNREASSSKAAEAARLENRDANYLEMIKDDLRQSVHESDNINAAGLISQEFERAGLEARRIERAPFYVLAKSHMPSILVETAFITNRDEEQKLRTQTFCHMLAAKIVKGVRQYAQERNATP